MKSRGERHTPIAPAKFTLSQHTALIVAIIIAVAMVYLPVLRGDFVWDDFLLITGNPLLQNFSGLLEIWSGGRTADYFPLTNTVFWIEHHLFGVNANGYHAVDILLQIANALLVWRLLKRLNVPGAWLAGLIFGIHPVHVASVAWISELKNLLAMFFALLSILCFLKLDDKRMRNSAITYAASLVFFALALLSKTQVVFLPFVLLLCAWWQDKKSTGTKTNQELRRDVIRSWPFFALAIVFGLVTMWFQNRGIGEEEIVIGSFPRRFANPREAEMLYAAPLFAPVRFMAN